MQPAADSGALALAHSPLADLLSIPLIQLDSAGLVVDANNAAEVLFGYSRSGMLGHSMDTLIQGEALLPQQINAVLGQGYERLVRDLEITTRSGEYAVDCWLHPLLSDAGKQVLLEIHDLDSRRKTEGDQRHRNQVKAAHLVQQVLSHEIRNPLGGMRGAAQLLARSADNREQQEYADLIIREVDRLNELVQRLAGTDLGADLSREYQAENIHQLLDDVLLLVSAEAETNFSVSRDFDPSIPRLQVHGSSIKQIFINLLRNAMQADAANIAIASRTRYGVFIGSNRISTAAEFSISDDGAGVAEAMQSQLFLPAISSKPKGQGLGLALSQNLALEHGGTLKYEALPKGSRFSLILPINATQAADE